MDDEACNSIKRVICEFMKSDEGLDLGSDLEILQSTESFESFTEIV